MDYEANLPDGPRALRGVGIATRLPRIYYCPRLIVKRSDDRLHLAALIALSSVRKIEPP
jgi:hypothetical protein